MDLINFQQALNNAQVYKQRHLLLGNGFSIACVPTIFTYQSLFNEADFKDSPQIKKAFEILKTTDFELVIQALEQSGKLLEGYDNTQSKLASQMLADAEIIKDILIQTIANNHPGSPADIPDAKFNACSNFLSNFITSGKVYTLNYDLLLYWTLMFNMNNQQSKILPCDGFGRDTFINSGEVEVSDYVTWQGTSKAKEQNVHYLHGALHLFDAGRDLQKYTWIDTGVPLVDQTRLALQVDKFPIFVSEGNCDSKMDKITHSAYLYHNFKSFSGICSGTYFKKPASSCLFTYGVSFAENDNHILECISKGTIQHLFVGLYGNPETDSNQQIIKKALELGKYRSEIFKLKTTFYDAESANVWGKTT
ncbi:hypothetical protein FPG59_06735 [Flavobacterium sp. FPG59]|nr:hypothetical protein FPG59_06735 [Flavobacterium sp. FPG59]